MRLFKLFITVGVLSSAWTTVYAAAADIYITPDGNPTGACTANTHNPAWFNSTGNWGSGSAQIGPGTTVHLCGSFIGTAGQQLLVGRGSGTSGSPITLKFESGANLTAPYWSSAGAISLNSLSYFVVDGGANGTIQNTANGTNLANRQASMAISMLSCNNCEVRNLTVANIYVHQKCLASGGCDGTTGMGTKAISFSGSNISFHDMTIHDVAVPIQQQQTSTGSNYQIYNNNIYNFNTNVIGGNYTLTNFSIFNNHFHDMDVWDTGTENFYHHEAIHAFGSGTISNLYIYNNQFDGNAGDCCVTGWIYIEGTSILGTAYVFNNVIVVGNYGQVIISSGTNHIISNNTFIANGGQCLVLNSSVTNVSIQNNAFDGCAQYLTTSYDNGAPPTFASIDYNTYGYAASTGNTHWQFGSKSGNTLSAWQVSCGCDSHSTSTPTTHLALSSTGVPQSTYSGVGKGLNLINLATGSLAPLAYDTGAGNTHTPVARPSSGAWVTGAYTYVTQNAPAPPTATTTAVDSN